MMAERTTSATLAIRALLSASLIAGALLCAIGLSTFVMTACAGLAAAEEAEAAARERVGVVLGCFAPHRRPAGLATLDSSGASLGRPTVASIAPPDFGAPRAFPPGTGAGAIGNASKPQDVREGRSFLSAFRRKRRGDAQALINEWNVLEQSSGKFRNAAHDIGMVSAQV